ncbi:unnamed protein product [Rhizophagus irregularis]|nr:unnamed protein product [Rhizophagus irregularis]
MEEDYRIFMGKSTIQKYLQLRHSGIKEAQLHHHPAQIRLAAVGKNEMNEHIDEHYCLASVKGVKSFASAFSQDVVLISQDDKAKDPLGIAAVEKTFKTLQTANEPVSVPDHDFPKGAKHKLIPSVYLVINPSNTNDSLRSGKMRIFVRPEYFLGTPCETHMVDLVKITEEESFHEFTYHDGIVKPIWCLLTNGGPDKNPRFLANIMKYVLLFKKLDLDYLTVRTHALGQSAYNPVERSMASLSGKLAGIVFNAFNYGNHLDTEVMWDWIDCHSQICKYSFDLCKCNNRDCCRPPRALDVFDFLSLNGGFLSPVVQDKNKHFLSLLHTLEYINDRLPSYYDMHCPSISSEIYDELVCKKCGKYFPTKAFLKMHTKVMHQNGREKIVQMVQEKENNTIPEVHAGEISHTQHKYANVEANGNAKNDIRDGKYKRSGVKKSQLWEQDHLTFQI